MLLVQNSDIGRMSLSSNNEHMNTSVNDYTQFPIDPNNFSRIWTYDRELIGGARLCVHVITHDTKSCAADIPLVTLRSLYQNHKSSDGLTKTMAEPEFL